MGPEIVVGARNPDGIGEDHLQVDAACADDGNRPCGAPGRDKTEPVHLAEHFGEEGVHANVAGAVLADIQPHVVLRVGYPGGHLHSIGRLLPVFPIRVRRNSRLTSRFARLSQTEIEITVTMVLVAATGKERLTVGNVFGDGSRRTELHERHLQERAVRRETVAKKEAELTNARLSHERSQSLLKAGLIARNEADRDRTAYEVQQKELAEAKGQLSVLEEQTSRNQDIKRKELAQAQSELKILLAGSRKESIRAVESQVKKLEEKLNILGQQKEFLKIRSPIEGVVSTSYLQNRIGDFLDKGSVFCEIVSEGTVIVEMPVPEKEIGEVRLGYPITIKVRGYPKRWYQARVKSIAPVAAASGMERTVVVQGVLENPDGSLKAGMTGVGKILCGKRTIFAIASRRVIRWLRTEFWEFLP